MAAAIVTIAMNERVIVIAMKRHASWADKCDFDGRADRCRPILPACSDHLSLWIPPVPRVGRMLAGAPPRPLVMPPTRRLVLEGAHIGCSNSAPRPRRRRRFFVRTWV